MQTSMTGRPRPVTATVTKPKWMQIPNPDAMRKIRRRSLDSNGSTASLTSLLDHDSYCSGSEVDGDDKKGTPAVTDSDSRDDLVKTQQRKRTLEANVASTRRRTPSPAKSKSSDSQLSAWEQWVIEKAKDDHRKKQEERKKKRQEKAEKERLEQEKKAKLAKAEIKRQSWVEQKNQVQSAQRKLEKLRLREEKRKKEEAEAQIREKADAKFVEWQNMKKEEERERRRKTKEENRKIKEHKEMQKQKAEACFQAWLSRAYNRPKSAPNSFGYLSGKMTGYHDRSAYPQPSFVNPIPWQPVHVPSSKSTQKNTKPKAKPYKWNPDKYL